MSRWTLILRPEGDGPPAVCRVRRLLKLALRRCGLRCIEVRHDETPRPSHADDKEPEALDGAACPGGAKNGTQDHLPNERSRP